MWDQTIFRDSGLDGLIIKLEKLTYSKLLEDNKIEFGAATRQKSQRQKTQFQDLSFYHVYLEVLVGQFQ